MKKIRFYVSYSLFVNNVEYPKREPFYATDATKAQEQCEMLLESFKEPGSTYKIHSTEKVNSWIP